MSSSRLVAVLALLLVAFPPAAHAVFHVSHISEIMSGVGADPTVQYVEVSMDSTFQNAVGNTRLTAFNCNGTSHQVLMIVPSNVANQGAGVKWIMASQSFAAASGITPDFTWNTVTDGSIDPVCGMVCWGAPGIVPPMPGTWMETDPNQYVDCIAYGGYTGPTKTSDPDADGVNSSSGTPTNLPPGDGSQSLTRTGSTNDNLADFALVCPPTPTNNAGMMGVVGCTTTTTTTTSTTTTTVVSMASACAGAKLKATGTNAKCALNLEAGEAKKGVEEDETKLAACGTKMSKAFAKAETKPPCLTTGDTGTIQGKVDAFVDDIANTESVEGGPASACDGGKIKAVRSNAGCRLSLEAGAAKKGGTADPAKVNTCGTKMSSAFAKKELKPPCTSTSDTSTIQGKVDAFVNDVKSVLRP
jgi:hypothetical protein